MKPGKKVTLNFAEARMVDHTFMEQLHHFEEEYQHGGGTVSIVGFDHFQQMSNHPLAARKIGSSSKFEIQLSTRQIGLRKFAMAEQYAFNPMRVRTAMKYKGFPIEQGNKIQYEENFMEKYIEAGKISVSDITLRQLDRPESSDTNITVVQISETDFSIPDFALEPEGLGTKLSEMFSGKDIDFNEHPGFSKMYYLRGLAETQVRSFFAGKVVTFLESHEPVHIEAHKNRLLFYQKHGLLDPDQIVVLEQFAEDFVTMIESK